MIWGKQFLPVKVIMQFSTSVRAIAPDEGLKLNVLVVSSAADILRIPITASVIELLAEITQLLVLMVPMHVRDSLETLLQPA